MKPFLRTELSYMSSSMEETFFSKSVILQKFNLTIRFIRTTICSFILNRVQLMKLHILKYRESMLK